MQFPWGEAGSVTPSEACSFVFQSLEQILAGPVEPVAGVPTHAASTYDGFLVDGKGNAQGTIQVKVGKSNARTGKASVKATVLLADGTKKSLKAAGNGKVKFSADGPTTVALSGGEACSLTLDADGFLGSYGVHVAEGVRNYLASTDADELAAADEAVGKWLGPVNVSWDGGSLGVMLAKKGKAKVKGTLADGKTKVAVNTQFLFGETWSCVPVVAPNAKLAFLLWFLSDGRTARAEGLSEKVYVGRPGALASDATFHVSTDAADWSAISGKVLTDYLPDGVKVTPRGTKWVLPKAGKVAYKDGAADASKLLDNPSALKLTYKAADGSFKGSFKVYAEVNGKPKATTVNVTGYLVDGVGHGSATIWGKFSVPVTIR